MEDQFVKKVKYLTDIERTGEENEEWQLRVNLHEQKRKELKPHKLTPLSIVVTPTIERCKQVGDELRAYLVDQSGMGEDEAKAKVLVVFNNAPDIPKLASAEFLPLPAQVEAKSHMHAGYEFLYVVAGELAVRHGDQEPVLGAGDAVYFDAGAPHSYRSRAASRLKRLSVTIHQTPAGQPQALRAPATAAPRTTPAGPSARTATVEGKQSGTF